MTVFCTKLHHFIPVFRCFFACCGRFVANKLWFFIKKAAILRQQTQLSLRTMAASANALQPKMVVSWLEMTISWLDITILWRDTMFFRSAMVFGLKILFGRCCRATNEIWKTFFFIHSMCTSIADVIHPLANGLQFCGGQKIPEDLHGENSITQEHIRQQCSRKEDAGGTWHYSWKPPCCRGCEESGAEIGEWTKEGVWTEEDLIRKLVYNPKCAVRKYVSRLIVTFRNFYFTTNDGQTEIVILTFYPPN